MPNSADTSAQPPSTDAGADIDFARQSLVEGATPYPVAPDIQGYTPRVGYAMTSATAYADGDLVVPISTAGGNGGSNGSSRGRSDRNVGVREEGRSYTMTVPDGMALGGSVGTRHPYEAERSNNNNNVYAIEDLTYENFLGTSSSTKKKRKHSLSDESDNPYAPESFAHLDLRNGKWPPMPSHLRYYFRPQLEGFLRDPYNGAIIGWGYAPNQHLSYEQWQEAAQYGSWEAANYNTDGWALITHFLTIEQAKKKFGETTINKNDDGSFRNMCFTLTKDGKVLERTHFVVELQPKSNLRP